MVDREQDDIGVRYTTKELLEEIRQQVVAINTHLLAKADLATVIQMNLQLDDLSRNQTALNQRLALMEQSGAGVDHDKRLIALERSDAIYQATAKDRKYLYGAVLTLITLLIGVGGLLISTLK